MRVVLRRLGGSVVHVASQMSTSCSPTTRQYSAWTVTCGYVLNRAPHTKLGITMIMPLIIMISSVFVNGQNYAVIHRFVGNRQGAQPFGSLLLGDNGEMYGTTTYGGTSPCLDTDQRGCGTVFKIEQQGVQSVLHRFRGPDGAYPTSPLVRDAVGNLYGAAPHGGYMGGDCTLYFGCGVLFKIGASGGYTILYRFKGGPDGFLPFGQLVIDSVGNLYGTTYLGGDLNCFVGPLPSGCGTVFKIDSRGRHSVLHSFKGGAMDGSFPNGVVNFGGSLYGTTLEGGVGTCFDGNGCGIIFKIDATGGQSVLYSFTGNQDGGNPQGNLVGDRDGNLYGVTEMGMFSSGTVFRFDPSETITTLYNFTGGPDGRGPMNVVRDKAGNLFGTAVYGGDPGCNVPVGCGLVFKVSPRGKETVLHTFTSFPDGALPESGVVLDQRGNLYGTAIYGGDPNADCFDSYNNGCGIIFKLKR
jgi:uncharacterized repeat protein (TIGR03803 family)